MPTVTTKSKQAGRRGAPGTWKRSVGQKGRIVTAYERSDKDNVVWLRWARLGTGKYDRMTTGLRLRDEFGRLMLDRVAEAEAKTTEAYHALLAGHNPRTPPPLPSFDAPSDQLTVAAGLALALTVPDGMYATETDHVRDMRRYRRYLQRVLEPGMAWSELTSVTYEQVWRKLAHLKKDEGIGGRRSTELAIVLLAHAGRWLHRAGKIKDAPAEPGERYDHKLSADWHRITKESTVKAVPPRHTVEEMGRLLLNVDNRAADPRIRLAFRLAGEARLGQALRCFREQMDLETVGDHGLGRFTIPDNVTKLGAKIDLTPELRAAVEHEMAHGYLRELETAYRAGYVSTYPLFPGRRLVHGVARADSTSPIGDRGATDLWHAFELASGVAVVKGRGWYGVRRVGADIAEDVETDGRALNAITGHQSDEMRRRVYQEKERNVVLAKASTAREAARANAIEAAKSAGDGLADSPSEPSHWEQVADAKRARRRAMHTAAAGRAKPTYPPKPCANCGTQFEPTGPNSKACEKCSPRRIRPHQMGA